MLSSVRPTISKVGTLAVIKDPFGAFFAVIQPDPEMQAGA